MEEEESGATPLPAVELVVSGTFKSLVFPSGLIFMGWGWLSEPAGTGGWFQVLSQHFRSSHEVGPARGVSRSVEEFWDS